MEAQHGDDSNNTVLHIGKLPKQQVIKKLEQLTVTAKVICSQCIEHYIILYTRNY